MTFDGPVVPRVDGDPGSITVVHVDDDPELVELAATLLERENDALTVRQATSAAEALDYLDAGDVDCVVSDYEMPGRDGLDLLRAVRDRDPELPFVLFSTRERDQLAREAVAAGATDYLQKGGVDQYVLLSNRIESAVSRRRTERALRRALGAMETTSEAVALLDEAGIVRYVSRAYAALTGTDRSALLGSDGTALVPGVDGGRLVPADAEDGRWAGTTVQDRPDGHRLSIHTRAAVVPDGAGGLLGVALFATDADRAVDDSQADEDGRTIPADGGVQSDEFGGHTGRREPGVSDRERMLRDLHRATRDLMRAATRERIAELTTEALAEILTLTHAAVHLHDPQEAALVPVAWTGEIEAVIGEPPDLGPGSRAWTAYRSGEVAHFDDLREVADLHNEQTSLRSELIVPLADQGAVLVASTQPGAFDENDRRLTRLLCENVTAALDRVEREDELRRREEQLQRENDRLDEFASIVSHDLRNPLNVATGRLDLASEDCDCRHVDDAADALERMETIIEDVLALAREGETVDAGDPVDLSRVVERCWANVDTDGAELRLVDDPTIRADESRLGRAFENLFRNAVEHGPTGNRTESGDPGDAPDVVVSVGALTGDDGVPQGFYVEDDGVGVPAEERDQVFEAGYSMDAGTGFGLRIVRDIVEAHGWTIDLTDAADGGARFEIRGVETA
jgi:PAS domain S-box-containing protein